MIEEIIKPKDLVKVYSKRQDAGELIEHDIPWILKGRIFQVLSDTELEILAEEAEPELQKNVCYILYLFSYEKVFLCTAYFQGFYTEDGKVVISFELLSPLEKVQRRMHQRVSSHAKLSVHRLSEEKVKEYLGGNELLREDIEKIPEPVSSTEAMIDISAGGIRFTTNEQIRTGEYVYLQFDVTERDFPLTISAYGQIIYSEPFRNEAGIYDIRLKFVGMPEMVKEKIIHYVFQIEREKRKMGGRVS
ncbi:MAG: PilZ domain-containing protein [Lachnospiraceae bacterium]|nr:PilZ domain-containing protein [Lachnospiraceae bacterium]